MNRLVRITTGARLHFGLLSPKPPFGGIGVMLHQPATSIVCAPSDAFAVDRSIEPRALPIARRWSNHFGHSVLPAVEISVQSRAPAHCGFGSGTQLSLAIAEGIVRCLGKPDNAETLATKIADRGKRSRVGLCGYFCGGLIYDLGTDRSPAFESAGCRFEFPQNWRVVLIRPRNVTETISGETERMQFQQLSQRKTVVTGLRETIDREILPAVQSANFQQFATAIQQYNRQSGLMFETMQGGPYNGADVTDLINRLQDLDVVGIGQSSWGPGVFAWCESEQDATDLANRIEDERYITMVTGAMNQARLLQQTSTRDQGEDPSRLCP